MTTATYIKNLDNFNGVAKLYKLSDPLKFGGDYEGDPQGETSFIAVSAANAMFSGPETYIFPCDENGKVIDWGELDGSYKGGLSHETALTNAGYIIA